jgi:hypothetical protein
MGPRPQREVESPLPALWRPQEEAIRRPPSRAAEGGPPSRELDSRGRTPLDWLWRRQGRPANRRAETSGTIPIAVESPVCPLKSLNGLDIEIDYTRQRPIRFLLTLARLREVKAGANRIHPGDYSALSTPRTLLCGRRIQTQCSLPPLRPSQSRPSCHSRASSRAWTRVMKGTTGRHRARRVTRWLHGSGTSRSIRRQPRAMSLLWVSAATVDH